MQYKEHTIRIGPQTYQRITEACKRHNVSITDVFRRCGTWLYNKKPTIDKATAESTYKGQVLKVNLPAHILNFGDDMIRAAIPAYLDIHDTKTENPFNPDKFKNQHYTIRKEKSNA